MVYDLVIIGGGINGVSIAHEAASRGLKVALCEKNDIASGTSSLSSKLIHGGLRYLEHYDFKLVKHALSEREIWLKRAPHLTQAQQFILPHESHLRPKWLLRIGLWLYDHLSQRQTIPASRSLQRRHSTLLDPLKAKLKHGFSYYDCWCDDARLTLSIAKRAEHWGAKVMTYTSCEQAAIHQGLWQVHLKNSLSGQTSALKSKALVNATGPWLADVADRIIQGSPKHRITLVKGSHIVVPRLYQGDQAYILQNIDGRIVFVIPFQSHFSLIGTTDVAFHQAPEQAQLSQSEAEYLLAISNHYFKKPLTLQDIIWDYAGVRPLLQEEQQDPSKVSRDYEILIDQPAGLPPLLSIAGGKLTTARRLALDCMTQLVPTFPNLKPSISDLDPLYGADLANHSLEFFTTQLKKQYSDLDQQLLDRWCRLYGSIAAKLAKQASIQGLGKHFGHRLYQIEVDYLCQQEWARSCEDILYRRTKLGLTLPPQQQKSLADYIGETYACVTR